MATCNIGSVKRIILKTQAWQILKNGHKGSLSYALPRLLKCFDKLKNMAFVKGWRRETGLSPPLNIFTDRSKAVLRL